MRFGISHLSALPKRYWMKVRRARGFKRTLLTMPLWPPVLGAIFCLVVAIQAQRNDEDFPNQAATTLRFLAGKKLVNRLEYGAFTLRKTIEDLNPIEPGEMDREVQKWLATPIAKRPAHPAPPDRPAEIKPLLASPKADFAEGQWQPLQPHLAGMWLAKVRVSAEHPEKIVHLVAMDQHLLRLNYMPGRELTGAKKRSRVPRQEYPILLAAFNGGFRLDYPKETGQIRHGQVLQKIKGGRGTIFMGEAGTSIFRWKDGDEEIYVKGDIRQNLPPMIENGLPSKELFRFLEKERLDFRTYRSGLGVTADGRWLINAFGRKIEPRDLAVGLQLAGCAAAVHLDQNRGNIFFNYVPAEGIDKGLEPVSNYFKIEKARKVLSGNVRDFFYVTKLPAEAVQARRQAHERKQAALQPPAARPATSPPTP